MKQAVALGPDQPNLQAEEHSWGGLTLRHVAVNALAGSAFLGPKTERFRLTFLFEKALTCPARARTAAWP